ncbi:regulatory protein RecX [Scatolibacter rhodanostii]|uniref:regulatory protein RecX n=1 Tax=Scatolibacter rhodanostii TaxID=2014781 RepID=UPI000C08BF5C|nr:RecX family transcriptional regulator [Scatolibacter rhodanostii]
MLITAIEPRRKSFMQLYIDGESAVKIDKETLLKSRFRMGMEITDEELHELIQQSDARRAHEKALYLLEHRNHSKKELEDKIARTAASREAAKIAAEHMEEIGLLNDERFARDFAQMLFERKKFGARRVRQELYQKGIDRDLIDEILEEYAENDTGEAIHTILEKKYSRFAEDEKIKRRAIAALQRLGYRFDEIKSVMQNWDEEEYE